ncbi:erythromycin esterase family protein [Streptomyces triticagri]|uniref:Erythromycin esterase family protein n=1 Tax=Streptomyces triticagri TaxID=2293568 RepID=A0A372M391_9ACTN|nr:erythromycin esterase family protein [Streptomyces triticagri]RFU84933.1 erythromycin esterase family protein [Streptomyces triticagri]
MGTDSKDATRSLEASSVLGLLTRRPRLLALGEPTHCEETLLEVRNDLFRQLVEEAGYRTIAMETDCLTGLTVDAYVTSGSGTLDEVMEHGFSHGWGAFAGNRDLVRWMRAHNADRPASEQIRFAGFDGPLEITGAASPRQALTALHDHLAPHLPGLLPCTRDTLDALLGPDDHWTNQAAMTAPGRSVGRSPEADRLRLLADDLTALLDAQTPHLLSTASRESWTRARLYARTATGLLRYHYLMADTSPARMPRLLGQRDAMMAENLLATVDRGPTLVHAHNSHLQRVQSSMRMWDHPLVEWWSAGALVNARLGPEYAFVATALGTIRHQGVGAPAPDTLEGHLHELPGDRGLFDPAQLAATFGDTLPVPRESPWFGYAPLAPSHLPHIDALLYVKDMAAPESAPVG